MSTAPLGALLSAGNAILWTGNLREGSITITGLQRWKVIGIGVSTAATEGNIPAIIPIVRYNSSAAATQLTGLSGTIMESALRIVGANVTLEGDTITYNFAGMVNITSSRTIDVYSQRSIIRVVGIL